MRWAALGLSIAALGACTPAPDMSDVQAMRRQSTFRFDLFQAVASNGKTIVATATGGGLLTSADQGGSWKRQMLAAPSSIIALAACADGSYVAVDFYKKAWFGDASGAQWKASELDKGVNPLAVTCGPDNKAWVVGSNLSIQSSADQGQQWSKTQLGGDAMLTTVQFLDGSNGVAMGEFGTMASTSDGGKTWSKSTIAQKDFYPYSAVFANRQQGWVSGLAGVVMQTADAGKTWKPQTNATGVPLYALTRVGEQVYGVGAGGVLAQLRDGQWVKVDYDKPAPAFLAAVAPVQADKLAVAGAAGALQLVKLPQ